MEPWVIVVIVAIVATTFGNIYRLRLQHRSVGGANVESELESIKQRLGELESRLGSGGVVDRLNALEAIVTDSRWELDREIKRLTDTPSKP
jgi:hypothetical protein